MCVNMVLKKTLCTLLLVFICSVLIECRSYNTGLIFYNLENHNTYLPPTISVSRGRVLANFKYSPSGSIWSTFGKPCECDGPLCGCCVGIKVKQYNFDQKLCANVSYAPRKDEVQLEVFFNDTATAKYGISARNPSPLCVPIMMGIPMSMCIQMSNIGIQGDNLNMCMDFLVRLASTELFEMHFQCMKMGLQGIGWVVADGQPVIPENAGKLKDKIATNSDEYYDEGETENEIISNETDTEDDVNDKKEEDLNKAEEEMDNNDITEKLKDIVKEKEEETVKDSSVTSQENADEGIFGSLQQNENVEAIVTNIMESINQANNIEEIENVKDSDKNEMELNKSDNENSQEMKVTNIKEEPLPMIPEPVMDLNYEVTSRTETKVETKTDFIKENNNMPSDVEEFVKTELVNLNEEKVQSVTEQENKNSGEVIDNNLQDKVISEHSQQKEMENNQTQTQVTIEAPSDNQELENIMTPIIVLEETTTQKIINEEQISDSDKNEIYSTTTKGDINKIDNELLNPLNFDESTMKTSTEMMMSSSNMQTLPENITTTSENIMDVKNIDNSLTTAATMTTTTKPTVTNKPKTSNSNAVVAATFVNATDLIADKNNSNDDLSEENEEQNENNNDDDDEDDDDNSHENDSDYEDDESEESEEAENETHEKDTESIKTTTIIKSNSASTNKKNSNVPKESLAFHKDGNNSNKNEFQSAEDEHENTNDQFETEEGEGEDYDDEEFEDYTTATAAQVINPANNLLKTDNNTCCHPSITTLSDKQTINDYKAQIPQINNVASHNLQFVSKNNNMTSQTDDRNMLSIKSSNKMSTATIDSSSTDTVSVTASSTNAAISNVMPLPLARKIHSQQYSRYHLQHPQQQPQRQSRQRQFYI